MNFHRFILYIVIVRKLYIYNLFDDFDFDFAVDFSIFFLYIGNAETTLKFRNRHKQIYHSKSLGYIITKDALSNTWHNIYMYYVQKMLRRYYILRDIQNKNYFTIHGKELNVHLKSLKKFH